MISNIKLLPTSREKFITAFKQKYAGDADADAAAEAAWELRETLAQIEELEAEWAKHPQDVKDAMPSDIRALFEDQDSE